MKFRIPVGLVPGAALACLSVLAANPPIQVQVDASQASRRLLHSRLQIPVQPGKLTLVYPKWIPGEHGPNGPITDMVGLSLSASGKTIEWQRDPEDMFAFNLEVPQGTETLEVAFDFLYAPASTAFSSGSSTSDRLAVLSWNQVVLYPKGAKAAEVVYAASLRLPDGWQFGTALPIASQSGATVQFSPVTLEKLVDSPVLTGLYFRTLDLTPGGKKPVHFIHVAADSAAALEVKPETVRHFSHLVAETDAWFGARHYESYHFLLSLSEHGGHFGFEHHESSDDRAGEKYLTDDDMLKAWAILLPHEMTHSWNGKFRRPLGLATPDYQQPMKGELLWVYEGLTDYLGAVFATRCGLWTNATFREYLALEAAALDREPGRQWRPLSDTTAAAQLLYLARPEDTSRRRSVDFYPEGDLIWLEADVLIRQQTQGRSSLKDSCQRFYGGESSPPKVVPYTFDDLVTALKEIAPYDWRDFFRQRVYTRTARAPLGGIEEAGWQLTFTNSVPEFLKLTETDTKETDVQFSLGLIVKEDGYIRDVVANSPADQAGISPAMKLLAVNGRRWTPEALRGAIKATAGRNEPLELLVENADFFKTCKVDYHEGEKYPLLTRDASKPDLLSDILKPLTPAP